MEYASPTSPYASTTYYIGSAKMEIKSNAWGRHRHPNTWDYLVMNPFGMGGANDITLRGYTFHVRETWFLHKNLSRTIPQFGKHLPHFSLINMRVPPHAGNGTGFGKGATVSQSLDYNFKQGDLSSTSSAGAYTSFGAFNTGASYSKTYSFESKQWSEGNWSVSGGLGVGTARSGLGINVSYGAGGWSYGMGGYFNPNRPKVYKSPISDNYGNQNGECALRCLEEFSKSYGMDDYNYDYWLEQNEGKLGVHGNNIEGLIDNTGVFKSDPILPISDICAIPDAFTNDKRVMMGFETQSGGEHAVMVSKVKIWSNGNYKIYFSETSPVRIAPYSTSNLFNLSGARFWTFYR